MAKTKIEWADRSWNPLSGCEKVSSGCAHCYAEGIARRFWKDRKFTEVQVHPERLRDPMHWRKPSRIFVNSMSDLFHERVYDNECSFIDEVFAVAAACPQHTFMILTKRSRIMQNYFNHPRRTMYVESALEWLFEGRIHMMPELVWPLPNVWLGVSVEDQRAAEQRIPDLLATPAKVRFISCEPLLGPVYLDEIPQVLVMASKRKGYYLVDKGRLDWVIAGGESGPKARPMHPDWVRGLRDQCLAGNIPFFFEQWGEFHPEFKESDVCRVCGCSEFDPCEVKGGCYWVSNRLCSNCKNVPFVVFPDSKNDSGQVCFRVKKKIAGRLLDGREWNEFPMSEEVE